MILDGIYGLALLALGSHAAPPWRNGFDPGLSDLPLIEVPVTERHGTLAVLLTATAVGRRETRVWRMN